MRTLLLLAFQATLWSQDSQNPLVKTTLTPLGGVQRMTVAVPAPIGPNDDLGIWLPTRKVQVVLITPAGKRITEATSAAEKIDWRQISPPADPPDADTPVNISIRFPANTPPGAYVFELTPNEIDRFVEVTAAFRPEVQPTNPQGAGPQLLMLGPVNASPSAVVDFKLDQEEDAATIDVLVSDPNSRVRLLMPGNQNVTQFNATQFGLRWRTTDNPATLDAPAGMQSLSGLYIPNPGWHHVVTFQRAPRGAYRVFVDSDRGAEVRVAFLPMGRLIQVAFDSVDRMVKPRDAEVKLSAKALPGSIHTGDSVLLQVQFDGEPISRPIQFMATFEYRNGSAPPEVRRLPLYMGWSMDDSFRTYFQPEREGDMRIRITATGRTVTGLPFTASADVPPAMVKPVNARLLGIWEQPVDTDGNGLNDRLDIHVELEVSRPAAFEMNMTLMSRIRKGTQSKVQKDLPPGRQRLTVSFPAKQVLDLPGDGPYVVEDIRITLRTPDGATDEVQTAGYRIGTQGYRRAQWDPIAK